MPKRMEIWLNSVLYYSYWKTRKYVKEKDAILAIDLGTQSVVRFSFIYLFYSKEHEIFQKQYM